MDQVWFLLLLHLSLLKTIAIQRKCPPCIRYRYFEQKFHTTGQCPCVKSPGSNKCLSYDNRLQAANIDEALHTFPDLSIMTESALPLVSEGNNIVTKSELRFLSPEKVIYEAPKMYKCDGKECKACKRLIINAFLKANNNDFSSMNNIASEMPIDTDESLCIRNRSISRNVNHAIENATIAKEFSLHMKEFINLLKPKLRKRRNSNESKQKLMGTTITISCNYKKGEEIAQGWCGLCNLCWQWRKLPDDYFPTLLNEVSCDINDEKCLTGLGNCRPIMRAINILRNVGSSKSPRWIQKSVNTISACECQIAVGTPLYSLASH
ncbi:Uncharacterized protein ACO02O_04635 [Dirofilaria immitis]